SGAERRRYQHHPDVRPRLRPARCRGRRLLRHHHGHLQFLGGAPSENSVTITSAAPAEGASASRPEAPASTTSGRWPCRGSGDPSRRRTGAPLRCSSSSAAKGAPRDRNSTPSPPAEKRAATRAEETTSAPTRNEARRPATAGPAARRLTRVTARRMCDKVRLPYTCCNGLANGASIVAQGIGAPTTPWNDRDLTASPAQEGAHFRHQPLAQGHVHPQPFQGLRDGLLGAFDGVGGEKRLHFLQVPPLGQR